MISKKIFKLKYIFFVVVLLLITYQIFLSSWILLKGDVYYNEDIARDLLLLENITTKQPITLIGPRALAVSGIFHGPLWLYVNLPAYIIGQGNPISMGIFWIFLYVIYIGIVYYVAKKLFDPTVALFSALLLTSTSYMYYFNNTFGALLLFPLYFYYFTEYIKTLKLRFLLVSFFIIGLIIQFELAFGIPVLVVSLIYLLYFLFRKNNLQHLLSFSIILIPLSTYIIFDIRHNFIQVHSLINYIFSKKSSPVSFVSFSFLYQRIQVILNSSIQFLNHNSQILNILFIGLCIYIIYAVKKRKDSRHAMIFTAFLLLYIGYWLVTLLINVELWIWYYYEFTSIFVILFCSTHRLMNRYVFLVLFLIFYTVGIQTELSYYNSDRNSFIGKSVYSWQLYSQVARTTYADAPRSFGYYIYESDSLGYRTRYAMHYFQQKYNKTGTENIKQNTTYLLIDSTLSDNWWKKNRVHIENNPIKKYLLSNVYQIEKYNLNKKEIAIPSDPNLIDNLFFR